jgi:uncharacterized phage protein (TIGR02216 family)
MNQTRFAVSARGLAGLSSRALGWRPDEFWRATPEELATALAAFVPEACEPPDPAVLASLLARFPDEGKANG